MSRLKRILVPISAGLLLFFTLGAWSLASPVGSAPDDDFHLASIWCGQGERDGLCELGSKDNSRLVPDKAIEAACFAFRPHLTASCQGPAFLDEGFTLAETTRLNIDGGQYPAGFYFVTSFLANDNVAVSTVTIRLFNSALFATLLVTTWLLLPRALRFTLVGSVSLTFVPLGLFFVASANPSGWAFMSGALLVPTLLGWYMTEGSKRWWLGGMAAVAATLGFAARGDSAAYVIVGALGAMVLAYKQSQRFWLASTLPATLILLGAYLFLASGQTGLALGGQMGGEADAANPTSKVALSIINLLSLPALWSGIFGQGWGLGWLDTEMPALVPGIGMFLFAGVVFASLRHMSWRRAIAMLGVGAATVVVPVYILTQSGATVGQEVQPRYILPLITMFLAVAIAPSRAAGAPRTCGGWIPAITLSRFQVISIAVGLTAAQALALFSNLRRNVTEGSYNLDGATAWWWHSGPSPFGVLFTGALCWAALMAIFAVSNRGGLTRSDHAPAPARHAIRATGSEQHEDRGGQR